MGAVNKFKKQIDLKTLFLFFGFQGFAKEQLLGIKSRILKTGKVVSFRGKMATIQA